MNPAYEGKAKVVYDLGDRLLMKFKDVVTAGDGARRDEAPGKGALAAKTTAILFQKIDVPHHFLSYEPPDSIVVEKLQMIPLEVIVRFFAYGSYLRRMRVEPLREFSRPIVEFHLKDDTLHDPLVLEDDIVEAKMADRGELAQMKDMALRAAAQLRDFFASRGLQLLDVKFEFGRSSSGLKLADEISGDTIRVLYHGEHLDKEYYRKTGDVRGLLERYRKLLELISLEQLR
ncbi:phosphoribosylaminoimidazolesuccinocarboxamide synthase [Thermoproteus tenax]|nr:phosphoribosylaminoimidazolesuccinocarboxamide synthase [Thermoproteus tenax]